MAGSRQPYLQKGCLNGYTYDTQMTQGNYTGVDLILSKGINLIQTDHPQLLDAYLKQRGKR